jgi:hypothetical protein
VGGSMVVAADLSRSYIPLFVSWLVFATIPWAVTRVERPTADAGGPERPAPEDAA